MVENPTPHSQITTEPAAHTPPQGAAAHGENGHHGVRFEPSDVDAGKVFVWGLALSALVVVSAVAVVGFYHVLFKHDETAKVTDLPKAATADQDPAQKSLPKLEAIEDLRQPDDSNFQLLPRRAANYFTTQEELLTKGDKDHLPIQDAIKDLANRLAADRNPPPGAFSRRMYSKASAGRVETGGQ